MAKKVKMADIAAALNVSTVTVSKALSDQKGVSEELRNKIKSLAVQMDYTQPSTIKCNTRLKSYNIGVVAPGKYFGKYESFYLHMYQEVATIAVQNECFTMLEVISQADEKNLEIPRLIKEKKVDGLIMLGRPSIGYVRKIRNETMLPLVCLDFYDESGNGRAIISDGYYGTYMLTNHLFDLGHEDIAYVGTLLYTSSITDRYFGYCKSIMEHGQKVNLDWIIDDRDFETGDVTEFKITLPEQMPTAFVCNSDFTASYLIRALKDRKYRVPEEISVVGFDNYIFPCLCDIGITTYEVNIKEMAHRSISELLEIMNTGEDKTGVVIVEGKLIYKDSAIHR